MNPIIRIGNYRVDKKIKELIKDLTLKITEIFLSVWMRLNASNNV